MPNVTCLAPLCGESATTQGRCPNHARTQNRAVRSPDKDFYDSAAWRKARRKQLFAEPLCADPLGRHKGQRRPIAQMVHHVKPIQEGGPRRSPGNLMSTCLSCHRALHEAMKREAA